jgi:hypothetical protein
MWPKRKKGINPATKTAYPTDESVAVRLEQISNGHLSHTTRSGTDKKGNYTHSTVTRFHKNKPKRMGHLFAKASDQKMDSRY